MNDLNPRLTTPWALRQAFSAALLVLVLVLVLVPVLVLTLTMPANLRAQEETPDTLPAGPGQEEVFYTCSACHSIKLVQQQGLTRAGWGDLIDWMVEKQGMEKPDAETRVAVLDYLEQHYNIAGEKQAKLVRDDELGGLPVGKGAEETYYACSACHSIRLVRQQGQTRAGWDELLDWMVEEQGMAEIEAAERKVILGYLATYYNIDQYGR